jgi:DNA-binding CsgD family transcriptional regulator
MARMHVSLDTLRRTARLVDSVADLDEPAESPGLVLPGLSDLVGCDIATNSEIRAAPDRLRLYAEHPAGSFDPASSPALEAHLHEHPLLNHFRSSGDPAPAKISDFLSHQEFHNLGLYSEFYRRVPVEDQLLFTLPSPPEGMIVTITLHRAERDFTDADRDLLNALAGPLGNSMRRVRSRHRAKTAVAVASSDELAGLTGRELQVLQLAAHGRTNQAIARAVGISPRTVAKHLEHIYRKLGVTSRAAAVCRTVTAAGWVQAATPSGTTGLRRAGLGLPFIALLRLKRTYWSGSSRRGLHRWCSGRCLT